MAVSGLMGYDVPDWLANWLLERQNAAKNSSYYLNRPSPVATGAYSLFDEIGQSIISDSSGEGPGGTPTPPGINFAKLSLDELANVAEFGFPNAQTQNMARVGFGLLGLTPASSLFNALQAFGIAANKAAAKEYAYEVPLNFQEVEDELGLKALQELESKLAEIGLFSGSGTVNDGLPADYGKENYSQEMIDEAREQGVEPFGGMGPEQGGFPDGVGAEVDAGLDGTSPSDPSSSDGSDGTDGTDGGDPDGPGAGGGL